MASPDRNAEPDDLPDADVDARWSDIVARLGDVEQAGRSAETGPPQQTGPTTSGPPLPPEPPADPSVTHGEVRASGPRDRPLTPEEEAWDETESHFVPPVPEPVAHRDPLATLTWTVVVAVPVLAVLWVIARAWMPELTAPSWIAPTAGTAFVASVGVLVWRMPHRRDPDDHDPGAVV
ncbi:hypothetical protein ACNHYB_01735 [Isoptericola jiangsuensis]|uniref:hypothetical protein n=1 Tax=Isoptericola jiangsuensis TaxID=548579 RepID=UPI003AAE37EC